MYRILQYSLFFVAVVLLQMLLFDNLLITPYIYPLYYVVFIILLPVGASRAGVLLLGTALGVVMDYAMGTGGINTIATAAVAFLRPALINISMGKDVQHEVIPYGESIDLKEFLLFASLMVIIHQTVFFFFESLGNHFFLTVIKIILSSAVTLLLVWLTANLFKRIGK